jgi:hypothetical protein
VAASYSVSPVSLRPLSTRQAPNGTTLRPDERGLVPSAAGVATILAPAPAPDGATFMITDVDGAAATNPITVDGNGTTIDGAASVVLDSNGIEAAFILDDGIWRRAVLPRLFTDSPPPKVPFFRLADVASLPISQLIPGNNGDYLQTIGGQAVWAPPSIALPTQTTGVLPGTRVTPDFGSQLIKTTGNVELDTASFITFGTTNVPSIGNLRFSQGARTIAAVLNATLTQNLTILGIDAANGLFLGTPGAAGPAVNSFSTIRIGLNAGGTFAIVLNAVTQQIYQTSLIQSAVPRIGFVSNFASDARATLAMADANQAVPNSVSSRIANRFTGALTANRTATYSPHPATEDASHIHWIINDCTGVFLLVISTGTGATVSLASGLRAPVLFSPSGVTLLATPTL